MADFRRRFGDRYDGRLLRSLDSFYRIVPYIMRTRSDSQNCFDDKIDITASEAFIRKKRIESEERIGFLHLVIAALVRTISQKPGLNRFIAGQKIYARNEILISLALKKQLKEESQETTIKLSFAPADTLSDIVRKVNEAVRLNKKEETKNDADKTARLFMLCPGLLLKFLVWALRTLDYFGLMPRMINRVSPFHTSMFVTDLGSLGIQPVYHHLYDFGTTSIFIAFGAKVKEKVLDENHEVHTRKYINFRVVTDERIADGYLFASAFKLFRHLLQHPEELEQPPRQVVYDIE